MSSARRDPLHGWELTPREAIALQRELAGSVRADIDDFGTVRHVAGVDVGFEEHGRITRAAIAVLSFPGLESIESVIARRPTSFPYVPGLLSFRELPAVLDAFDRVREIPDLILCDGQGIAHPRRLGIAAHLGLWLDMPTIGVAKSRLIGAHGEVPPEKGGWCPLMDRGERIGAVLRTRRGVRPLFVSVGHRITLETAIDFVLRCISRYRLPETTRAAHRLASRC
ncbi:MAG: deoxyribonuclease V [Gammaproteobacteria bacterium]|jgi:deoxyribonuclease V|nr:deoxyribonuclease V [Gammaproteobacteria bacterium]